MIHASSKNLPAALLITDQDVEQHFTSYIVGPTDCIC